MWRWTLNWSEVRRGILVGSCPITPEDIDRIREDAGARALLSLQTDACRAAMGIDNGALAARAASRGLVVASAPMRDFDAKEQRKQLPGAVRRLTELLEQGHPTYVHCTAGINRGPLVVLGYLTFVEGMAVEDAMALIHRSRPEAAPCWDAYHGCRQDALAALPFAVFVRTRAARTDAPGTERP